MEEFADGDALWGIPGLRLGFWQQAADHRAIEF